MKRTLYYNGVELLAEHLNYTEETKIEAIRKIVTSFGICGVIKGLVITVDENDMYKIMITSGFGYTYGGDYYELKTDVRGIVINNSKNALNYIVIKVTSVEEYPVQDVVSGQVRYTRQSEIYEVKVFSELEWNNISDKSNYSLIGIVRGSGGVVRGSDIIRSSAGIVPLLFVENQPTLLKGVLVKTVSNNTVLGNGILRYEIINEQKKLSWKSPRSGSLFGNEVIIGADGVYRLWDDLSISYIDIEVVSGLLPSDNIDETLKIINLFEQHELSAGTMIDFVHRRMMGSGMPSPSNPHGQTLDDFDPGVNQDLIKHRRLSHSPAIIGERGSTSLGARIDSNNLTRLIINGLRAGEYIISGGNVIRNIGTLYITVPDEFSNKTVGIYIDENGGIGINEYNKINRDEYFVICSIYRNVDGTLDDLVDRRKWGSLRDTNVFYSGENLIAPNPQFEYSVNDSINMIKYVLKELMGTGDWKQLPQVSIVDLSNKIQENKLLIADYHVISNLSELSFTGLDSDWEWFYRLFMMIKNPTSDSVDYFLYFNGNSVDNTYWLQISDFNNITGSFERINSSKIVTISPQQCVYIDLTFTIDTNGYIRYTGLINNFVEEGAIRVVTGRNIFGICVDSMSKITSCSISASLNNIGVAGIGSGSKVLLYRFKTPPF